MEKEKNKIKNGKGSHSTSLPIQIKRKSKDSSEYCQLYTGTCHLPLQRLNEVLLQSLIFNTP